MKKTVASKIQTFWSYYLFFSGIMIFLFRNQFVLGWVSATVILLGGQFLIGRKGKVKNG